MRGLFFVVRIPTFECELGCHDCCGPVTAPSLEASRFPVKSQHDRDCALAELSCPYLAHHGCEVYTDRPLICRLFGTTPHMPCPHGGRPVEMVAPEIEHQIHQFLAKTRQVLIGLSFIVKISLINY